MEHYVLSISKFSELPHRRYQMLNTPDFGPRAKFGSSCKIFKNRYGVQNYAIIFPM
jgi:hypothetical protein